MKAWVQTSMYHNNNTRERSGKAEKIFKIFGVHCFLPSVFISYLTTHMWKKKNKIHWLLDAINGLLQLQIIRRYQFSGAEVWAS